MYMVPYRKWSEYFLQRSNTRVIFLDPIVTLNEANSLQSTFSLFLCPPLSFHNKTVIKIYLWLMGDIEIDADT